MRLRLLTIFGAALTSLVAGQEARPSTSFTDSQSFLEAQLRPLRPLSPAATRRVRDLLSQMTLKEKVGQMTQLEIGMIADGQEGSLRVNPDKLRKAVIDYGVGSILNVKDIALPPAKWHEIIGAIAKAADQTRLKIPVIYGLDSVHGANYVAGATIFPQALGMASTWDFELMLEASSLAAAETRSVGVPWNFSPVLDVGRQQQWPRLYETLGEDPYLATVLGVAAVRGYQGDDPSSAGHAAATLKHYIGYSVPISGHDRTPALIPDITMRDTLLPPFAAAVKAGALTVMVNSGEVNGIPGHVNKRLLNDLLRGELGFDGVIVSDWEDIKKLVKMHHTAANEKEATRAAILAGIDMSMVPSDYSFSDLLVQLVNEGAVPMSRIDDAVGRILTLKARVGLLDSSDSAPATAVTVGSAASRQVTLRAARESIVLAKNGPGVLPLGPSARVLLTGPTADSQVSLNNGWTITWLGDRASLYPADRPTVRRALEARLGARLTYVPGASYDKAIDVQAAATAASSADVVVLCLGEMSYAETPGNIDDLQLPDAQLRLAEAVLAAGKPVILLMIEGRPRIIRTIADRAAGIVIALNPGMEGGTAIADILSGEINPSGRLPITYPRFPNALFTYDYKAYDDRDLTAASTTFKPQFAFGSGSSYTTFEYAGLSTDSKATTFDQGIDVSVTVRNTGKRAGTEVVQLFVTDRVASVTPPIKRLKRFVRVDLAPGGSKDLRFHLSRNDLSFIDASRRPVTEAGMFIISVGGLTRDVEVK